MKIRVLFTLDVPKESMDALFSLAHANSQAEAADFVRMDAEDYVIQYFESNGVDDVKVVSRGN